MNAWIYVLIPLICGAFICGAILNRRHSRELAAMTPKERDKAINDVEDEMYTW